MQHIRFQVSSLDTELVQASLWFIFTLLLFVGSLHIKASFSHFEPTPSLSYSLHQCPLTPLIQIEFEFMIEPMGIN